MFSLHTWFSLQINSWWLVNVTKNKFILLPSDLMSVTPKQLCFVVAWAKGVVQLFSTRDARPLLGRLPLVGLQLEIGQSYVH